LSLVITGHVDHGKSTLVGRLLADTGNLPEGKLEAIQAYCARNSREMEYAFLLDALKDEQAQGITIDAARCFFKTARRDYIIIDAPGHIEFLRNMVTGAARADAALLVIDAHEGVQENSRRHGYFLAMLGVGQFAVVVNKMDLANYDTAVFERIRAEFSAFLAKAGLTPTAFIPVAARTGEMLADRGDRMPWYAGPTVLEAMDAFRREQPPAEKPLRFPVQDVYKFTSVGDERRLIVGRVESGAIAAGDRVVFHPSGKQVRVRSIEVFSAPARASVAAGEPAAITLDEQIFACRGQVVARADQPAPLSGARLRVDLFWLGKAPLESGKTYKLKLGTAETSVRLERVIRVLDASNLELNDAAAQVRRNEVAACVLRLNKSIAFDLHGGVAATSRFVIMDDYRIAGGGTIRENLPEDSASLEHEQFWREIKWVRGRVTPAMRAARYAQQAALVIITGPRGSGRKALAHELEQHLFQQGRLVYFLGMGSSVHGLDADITRTDLDGHEANREHIRRLGETLHILLDTGLLVICTALDLSGADLAAIRALVSPAPALAIVMAEENTIGADLRFAPGGAPSAALGAIFDHLRQAGILPAAQ